MLTTLALLLSIPGAASAIVDKKQDVKRSTSARFDQPMTIDAPDFKPSQPAVDKKGAQPSAQNVSQVPQRATGETFTVNGVSFIMVPVQGGTYTRGATEGQGSEAMPNEKPAHPVTVTSFSIGATEVTQELWEAVMDYSPSRFTGDPQLPVEMVSYLDCQAFIYRLNELTGRHFRLPTEAEWEYAARGGQYSNDFMYAGGTSPNPNAWYSDNSYETTHAVATKMPNELSIYDMSGNVAEWCQDAWGNYSAFGQDAPAINPWIRANTTYRVYRGGSAVSPASMCRVSARNEANWLYRSCDLGFRLVLSDLQGQNITFLQAQQQVTVNSSSATVPVAIKRGNTQGTYTAHLTVDCDNVSIVPLQLEDVTFADGQSIAYINVPFQQMELRQSYSCTISLSPEDAATANPEYGEQITSTTLTVTYDYNWVYAGTATMTDETFYSGAVTGVVTVQRAVGTNRYRLLSPYYVLYSPYDSDCDRSNFEFLYENGEMTIETGYYLTYWGYQMYYNSAYDSYCYVNHDGNTYDVNFLLYSLDEDQLYLGGLFHLTFNWGAKAPTAEVNVAPVTKPENATMRKKEFVPFHEIK